MLHKSETGIAARPLHCNTAMNALHLAFRSSSDSRTRLLILLQALAWAGDFFEAHRGELIVGDGEAPVDLGEVRPSGSASTVVQEIFEELPPRTYDLNGRTKGGYAALNRSARTTISQKVFGLVTHTPAATGMYMQVARELLCAKAAVEAHEFKLPPALFENCALVSPEWRSRLIAASAHWLHGRQSPDSEFLLQARQGIGAWRRAGDDGQHD